MSPFKSRGIGAYGRGAKGDVRDAGRDVRQSSGSVHVPIDISGEESHASRPNECDGARRTAKSASFEASSDSLAVSTQDLTQSARLLESRLGGGVPGEAARSAEDGSFGEALRLELEEKEREIVALRGRLAECEAELVRYRNRCGRIDEYVKALRERDRTMAAEAGTRIEEGLRATAERFRSFRDEMDESASVWQREIYEKTSSLERELSFMRQGLQQTVRLWREEMFRGKFESLGISYRQLCSILGRIEAANARRASEGLGELPESARLRRWLVDFERALASIGLEIIRPGCGEPFDSERHALDASCRKDGGLSPDDDLVVTGCALPGMGYRSDRDDLFVVVVQAIVTASRP